jgi:hypothetical protein
MGRKAQDIEMINGGKHGKELDDLQDLSKLDAMRSVASDIKFAEVSRKLRGDMEDVKERLEDQQKIVEKLRKSWRKLEDKLVQEEMLKRSQGIVDGLSELCDHQQASLKDIKEDVTSYSTDIDVDLETIEIDTDLDLQLRGRKIKMRFTVDLEGKYLQAYRSFHDAEEELNEMRGVLSEIRNNMNDSEYIKAQVNAKISEEMLTQVNPALYEAVKGMNIFGEVDGTLKIEENTSSGIDNAPNIF